MIEPDDGAVAIGTGGAYALAAARALIEHTDLPAEEIARSALQIAAELCIYTNDNITIYSIAAEPEGLVGALPLSENSAASPDSSL